MLFTIFPFVQNQDTCIFALFSAFGVTVGSVEFKTDRVGLILIVVQFKLGFLLVRISLNASLAKPYFGKYLSKMFLSIVSYDSLKNSSLYKFVILKCSYMHDMIENTKKWLEIHIFFKNVLEWKEVKSNFRKCD